MLQENTQNNAWSLLRRNEPRGRDEKNLPWTGKGILIETENFWLREKAIEAITQSIQLKDENKWMKTRIKKLKQELSMTKNLMQGPVTELNLMRQQ